MNIRIPSYTLLSKLGDGSMAEVWLGQHHLNARKAAIKILRPSAMKHKDSQSLFLREGRVLAAFDHPNIVKIYDNNNVDGYSYLAMEYLLGGTLQDRMVNAAVSVAEAIGIIAQLASALNVAHLKKVIHRDLKPANIMMRDVATPVLTDFGVARVLDESTVYGRDGNVVGTPLYMSPEQITGQQLTGSSDLYALGLIFFELLTGKRPFPGGTLQEIASQHLFAPVPTLPRAFFMLQPLLERLLAKKPSDRFATGKDLVDALRKIVLIDENLQRDVGLTERGESWSRQFEMMGFALDTVEKEEVRAAQAKYNLVNAPAETTQSKSLDPDARFELREAESVFDHQTGLCWAKLDNQRDIAWVDAEDWCIRHNVRLPSVTELRSLVLQSEIRISAGSETLRVSDLFQLSSLWFWTSEQYSDTEAWVVSLGGGYKLAIPITVAYNIRVLGIRNP